MGTSYLQQVSTLIISLLAAPPMNLVCQVCTWGDDVENLDGGNVQPNRCRNLEDLGEAQECPNEEDICFTHIAGMWEWGVEKEQKYRHLLPIGLRAFFNRIRK